MPNTPHGETQRAWLEGDREDLLTVLRLRFGSVSAQVQARIAACDDAAVLERWILVAANVPDWPIFLTELDAGPRAFKLVGPRYEPDATSSGSAASVAGTHERRISDGAQCQED